MAARQCSSDPLHLTPARRDDFRYLIHCTRQNECCALLGLSNVKSTLLRHLAHVAAQLARPGEVAPSVVFINCLGVAAEEQALYGLVLRRIGENLACAEAPAPAASLAALADQVSSGIGLALMRESFAGALRDLAREPGPRLILILDEFDDLFSALPPWPFRQLRALRDAFPDRLAYITATRRHLASLRSDAETYEFRELFLPHTRVLRPFGTAAAHDLLASLTSGEAAGLVAELSSGHPGLAGHLYGLFCRLASQSLSLRQVALQQAAADWGVEECHRLWAELEPEEQLALQALLVDGCVPKGEAAETLREKGMPLEQPRGWRCSRQPSPGAMPAGRTDRGRTVCTVMR